MNPIKLFLIIAIAMATMTATGAATISMVENASVTPLNLTNTSTTQFTVTFWPIIQSSSIANNSVGYDINNGTRIINCSIWTNASGTYAANANKSTITNNTINSIQVSAAIGSTNIFWAVQCFNNTSNLTATTLSSFNWTSNKTLFTDTVGPTIGNSSTVLNLFWVNSSNALAILNKNMGAWFNLSLTPGPTATNELNITVYLNDTPNGGNGTGIQMANISLEQNASILAWTPLNNSIAMTGATGNWSVNNWNISNYTSGLYNLTVRAWDFANNTLTGTAYVTISLNRSVLSLGTPSGGGTLSNVQTTNVTVTGNKTMWNCRYASNGTYDYATMALQLAYGNGTMTHYTTFTGTYGVTYNIAIACKDWSDYESRANVSPLYFSFSGAAPEAPPTGGGGTAATNTVSAISSIGADSAGTFTINKFDIATIVVEVTEAASSVKLTVQSLDSAPAAITTAPTGVVYKYYEITKENLADTNIKKGTVSFKVTKAWYVDNSYNVATTKLMRWANDAWTELTTTQTGSDDTYYTFSAETPGFSTFAVKAEAQEVTPTCNITCPEGKTLNTETCTCVTATPTCGADETLDTATNTCKKKETQLIAGMPDYLTYLILAIVAVAVLGGVYFYTAKTKKFPIKGK